MDGKPKNIRVFLRGNPANQGDEVTRRFLSVLSGSDPQPFEHGSGRLELAQSITDPANPLTARVWANRVWGYLFGAGLVQTPSDFGRRSDPPTHPDVLDWLACKLVEDGWSTKALIRRIVLSSTYRQKSDARTDAEAVDPENRLLARQNRRRLDFEALRDSLLAAAGEFDPTIGGPSVTITDNSKPRRRTLYAHIDRQNLPGLFRTFDFASPDTHAPRRFETTVPQQALYLLNSPFANGRAERIAARMQSAGEQPKRVRALYRLLFQRDPDEAELALGLKFVGTTQTRVAAARPLWRYGYGHYDALRQRTSSFRTLNHFNGRNYQGGRQLPDGKLGWVLVHANGGHPGNRPQHAAIRRWIAPAAGTLSIRGSSSIRLNKVTA